MADWSIDLLSGNLAGNYDPATLITGQYNASEGRIEAVLGSTGDGGFLNSFVEFQIPIQDYGIEQVTIALRWLRDLTGPAQDPVLKVRLVNGTSQTLLGPIYSGQDGLAKSAQYTFAVSATTGTLIFEGNIDVEDTNHVFRDSYLYYDSIIIEGNGPNPFLPHSSQDLTQSECPICYVNPPIGSHPIELYTGEKTEKVTDIAVNTPAGSLAFTRSFRQSKLEDFTTPLGLGWSHNHHIYLFEDIAYPAKLLLKMPAGGIGYFNLRSGTNDQYDGDPGSNSTIDASGTSASMYILTNSDESIWIFDDQKRLRSRTWANGEVWTYIYFTSGFANGLLKEVDDGYGRKLQFAYIDNSIGFDNLHLKHVGDHTVTDINNPTAGDRYVEFDYVENKIEDTGNLGTLIDGGQALLTNVQDVRANTWTYDYYGQDVLETNVKLANWLVRFTSPPVDLDGDDMADDSLIIKELDYTLDTLDPSLITDIQQRRGKAINNGNFLAVTNYNFDRANQQTIVREDSDLLRETKHHFNSKGLYLSSQDPDANLRQQGTADSYRPSSQQDANDNNTQMNWSSDGKLLNSVSDALNNQTQFGYDTADRLTTSIDAEERSTQYIYGDSNNPRQPTEIHQITDTGLLNLDMEGITGWQAAGSLLSFAYGFKERNLNDPAIFFATRDPSLESVATPIFQTVNTIFLEHNGQGSVSGTVTIDVYLLEGAISDLRFEVRGTAPTVNFTSFSNQALGDGWYRLTLNITYTTQYFEGHIYIGRKNGTDPIGYFDKLLVYDNRMSKWVNMGANTTSGWHGVSGLGKWMSDDHIDEGDQSLRVITATPDTGAEQALSLLKGNPYIISARVRNMTSSYSNIRMRLVDASDNSVIAEALSTGSAWQTLSISANVSQTINAKLQFLAEGSTISNNARAIFAIDTIQAEATWGETYREFVYNVSGQVTAERLRLELDDSLLQETTRSYWTSGNGNGLLEKVTIKDLLNPNNDSDTTYIYDAQGRVIKTHKNSLFGSCQYSYTAYDAVGQVRASACGLGNIDPYAITLNTGETWEDGWIRTVSDLYDALNPQQYSVRTYSYDAMGRPVTTTSNAGANNERTNRTIYDALGRVIRSIQNYNSKNASDQSYTAPKTWTWNATTEQWEDTSNPIKAIEHGINDDENILSYTEYNTRGLVSLRRDVLGRVTLYGYDLADRLVKTVQNASFPSYDATYDVGGDPALDNYESDLTVLANANVPDVDVITSQVYDPAGNVVKTTDARGTVTLTAYDALNRPEKVIQNAAQPDYDILNDPDLSGYGAYSINPDEDMVSETIYDVMGRVLRSKRLLENRGAAEIWDENYFVYDIQGRQVRSVQHYVAADPEITPDKWVYESGIWKDGTGGTAISHGDDDQNIITETIYDSQGRVFETLGINRRVTRMVYDGLNRPVKTVANYVEQGDPVVEPENWVWRDLSGDNNFTWRLSSTDNNIVDHGPDFDQNIISETIYDSDGRVETTRNVTGLINRNAYDTVGRQKISVSNYVAADPEVSPYYWEWVSGNTRWEDGSTLAIDRGAKYDQNLITQPEYDDESRVFQTRDIRGHLMRQVYDEAGRRVMSIANFVAQYDVSDEAPPETWYWDNGWKGIAREGQPTETVITISVGTSNDQNRISSTQYDVLGRVISSRDAQGRESVTVYDNLGRRVRSVSNYVVQGISEPENWEWANNRWEDGSGTAIEQRSDTLVNNFDQNIISDTVYNRAGQAISTRDARGTETSFVYDNAGRRLRVIQAVNTALATTSYTCYDKAGRVLRSIQNWIDNTQNPNAVDANGDWVFAPSVHGSENDQNLITEFIYDTASRRIQVIDVLGNVLQTNYFLDGQVDFVTDSENVVTIYRYDNLRRRKIVVQNYVVNSQDPENWVWNDLATPDPRWEESGGAVILHGINNDQNIIVQVGYDIAGRMVSLRDPRGQIINYEYDKLGRRTKLSDPRLDPINPREWTTAYSEVNQANRTVMNYPNGYDVQGDFDHFGQLKTIGYNDSANTAKVDFDYNVAGQRLKMTENNGTSNIRETTYEYDAVNRLTKVDFDDMTTVESVEYNYDIAGLRTELKMPDGLIINYTYDQKGRLISLEDWDNQVSSFAYDDANRHILTQRYDNATPANLVMESIYTYNENAWLTDLHHKDSAAQTLARFQYTAHDTRGNRLSAIEDNGASQQTIEYSYDALSRLLKADYDNGTTVYNYGYDEAGNMVDMNGVNRDYNAANQMIYDGTNTLTYDDNGNLTHDGVNSYTWDRANRMLSVGTTSYKYDGAGNRISQDNGMDVTKYLLDVQPSLVKVLAEKSDSQLKRFIHSPRGIHSSYSVDIVPNTWGSASWGQFTWGADEAFINETWQHMLQDGLGSVRTLVDNSAQVESRMSYDPYGNSMGAYGAGFGFAGEQIDSNGLSYNRARYYSPSLGVWTAEDFLETPNRYGYVNGNPINLTDSTGQYPDLFDLGQQIEQGLYSAAYNLGRGLGQAADAVDNILGGGDCTEGPLRAALTNNLTNVQSSLNQSVHDARNIALNTLTTANDLLGFGIQASKDVALGASRRALNIIHHTEMVAGRTPLPPGMTRADALAIAMGETMFNLVDIATTGAASDIRYGAAEGDWLRVGLGAVDFIPGLGDAASFVGRGALKYGDELLQFGARYGDDLFQAGRRYADDFLGFANRACSFSADTLVLTPDGETEISEIQIGDVVLGYNEEAEEIGAFVVTALYTQRHETTLDLTIDGELIHTTDEHPFYVRDKAWVEAGELTVGTEILKADGSFGLVEAIIVIDEPQTMYNLTVALAHTFVVGEQGWVVHNQGLTPAQMLQLAREVGNEVFGATLGRRNILFGQVGIRPNFSRVNPALLENAPGVYAMISGQPFSNVANRLRLGQMSPDDILIQYFASGNNLVTANNRGLATLYEAGLRPTNVELINPSRAIRNRLDETLRIPASFGVPNNRIQPPSNYIAVTLTERPSKSSEFLRVVQCPF